MNGYYRNTHIVIGYKLVVEKWVNRINMKCIFTQIFIIVSIVLATFSVKTYSQISMNLSISKVVDELSLNAPIAKIERLNFQNSILSPLRKVGVLF